MKKDSKKKAYLVSLDEGVAEEAKAFQRELSHSENLSGLLNDLLKEWIKSKKISLETMKKIRVEIPWS